MGVLRDAWESYRDESFIRQFLSPTLIRKMKLFSVFDDGKSDLLVNAIHDERGYRTLRSALADQFDVVRNEPEIEIVDVDLVGDRRLMLQHRVHNGIMLDPAETRAVMRHIADLWGYDVRLIEMGSTADAVLKTYDASPPGRS